MKVMEEIIDKRKAKRMLIKIIWYRERKFKNQERKKY
jgi:hypothetical protein